MHKQYSVSEKFTVLYSHVQSRIDKPETVYGASNAKFPVYYQLRPAGAPVGRGIPDVYLIDHEGKVIKHDSLSNLVPLIQGLIDKVPDPPPEILGDVEPQLLEREAEKLGSGKAIRITLTKLEKIVEEGGEESKEAQALIDAAKNWMEKEAERLAELESTQPAEALYRWDCYSDIVKGLPEEEKAKERIEGLKADSQVRTFAKEIASYYEAKEDMKNGKDRVKAEKKMMKVRKKAYKLRDDKKTSETLKAEIEAFLDTM